MTQNRYNWIWRINAIIVFASAWGFDKVQNPILRTLIGGAAFVATAICVVNHFRMYYQIQKEENEENQLTLWPF